MPLKAFFLFFLGIGGTLLLLLVCSASWEMAVLVMMSRRRKRIGGESPGTIRTYWDDQEKPLTYRDQNAWEGNSNRAVVHVIGREDLGNNNYFFAGSIDEVRFWQDKVRTASEIQEYMNKELSGVKAGLIGYWKFNEGERTTAFERSPNGSDETIVGAAWTTDAAPVTP